MKSVDGTMKWQGLFYVTAEPSPCHIRKKGQKKIEKIEKSKKIFEKVKPNFLFVDIYSEDLKKREDKKCLMMR